MATTSRHLRVRIASAFVALCLALGAEAAGPKRVLILHSFGRDFAPYDTITSVFRTELARRSAEPVVFVEANLDSGRGTKASEERAFADYLRSRFDEAPPNVVVSIGPPAARFYARYRTELFPAAPLVIGALDERFAGQFHLSPNDAVVAGRVDLPALVENILRLRPETETIAVVIGASELERFWREELRRELVPLAHRVRLEWLDELSLEQMQQRLTSLPARSAVLYGLLIVDAAGVPHERQDALASLHAVSNAPIFGIYESELGRGVVGGPFTSQRMAGEHIAVATLRALGEPVGSQARIDVIPFEPAVYDWRELQRWGIDAGRLPPGSEIRFRPPSIWKEHRAAVLWTATAVLLQAVLIAGLLLQRVRRRRAEQEAQHLGGRILTAQEDERRRLAREMHDDVTQRLAALAIDAAKAQAGAGDAPIGAVIEAIRHRLVKLCDDVHALSYRLHPSMIEDLGLVPALRAECNRVARHETLAVDFDPSPLPRDVPPNIAICLYRVAQEALRNVVRHANARNVEVTLHAKGDGVALTVADDGAGFGDAGERARSSLGLVSMRERVRLVGGTLDIRSRPERGTSVVAWVPLGAGA